jgi:hypothetical protein
LKQQLGTQLRRASTIQGPDAHRLHLEQILPERRRSQLVNPARRRDPVADLHRDVRRLVAQIPSGRRSSRHWQWKSGD